jgi:hypothetical protein
MVRVGPVVRGGVELVRVGLGLVVVLVLVLVAGRRTAAGAPEVSTLARIGPPALCAAGRLRRERSGKAQASRPRARPACGPS